MTRNVDLVSYLPSFMTEYKEPVLALEAENPEFDLLWVAKDKVLYNRFIETADEYGISRYEAMLGISPTAHDTLESRRSRVRSLWFNTIPYTMKTLIRKLITLCGEGNFEVRNDFEVGYNLTVITDLELYGQVEQLEHILDVMTPMNLVVDSQNMFNVSASGGSYIGGQIGWADVDNITPDFNENNDIRGNAYLGSVISETVEVQVTPDFNENNEILGASNVSLVMSVTEILSTESEE